MGSDPATTTVPSASSRAWAAIVTSFVTPWSVSFPESSSATSPERRFCRQRHLGYEVEGRGRKRVRLDPAPAQLPIALIPVAAERRHVDRDLRGCQAQGPGLAVHGQRAADALGAPDRVAVRVLLEERLADAVAGHARGDLPGPGEVAGAGGARPRGWALPGLTAQPGRQTAQPRRQAAPRSPTARACPGRAAGRCRRPGTCCRGRSRPGRRGRRWPRRRSRSDGVSMSPLLRRAARSVSDGAVSTTILKGC